MKNKKLLLISALLFIIGLSFSAVGFVKAKAMGPDENSERTLKSQEVRMSSTDGLNLLKLDLISENVKCIVTEEASSTGFIIIKYSDDEKNPIYEIKSNDEKLTIRRKDTSVVNGFKLFNIGSWIRNGYKETVTSDFLIEIPDSFTGSAKFSLTSGNLELEGLTLSDDVSIDKTSGKTVIKNVSVSDGDLDINTVSGLVSLENCSVLNSHSSDKTGYISVDDISGSVKLDSVTADSYININTTSGSTTLNNVSVKGIISADQVSGSITGSNITAEGMDLNTTSGKIELALVSLRGDFNADSISGKVNVTFTDSADNYAIDIDTISGNKNLNGESGNPHADKKLSVDTTSGDITISFDAK